MPRVSDRHRLDRTIVNRKFSLLCLSSILAKRYFDLAIPHRFSTSENPFFLPDVAFVTR